MDLRSILAACAEQGVELALNDGNLDVNFDTMPPSWLIEQLKSNKAALIDYIAQLNAPQTEQRITAVARDEQPLMLSPAQARLWLIDQIEGGSAQYNMPSALKITGPFDVAVAEQAFAAIISRHESLRTVFVQQGKAVSQQVKAAVDFTLEFDDISALEAAEQHQAIDGAIALEGSHIFDLSKDILLRAKVLKLAPHSHILLLNMHHIISDGWSVGVLTHELNHFYCHFSGHHTEALEPLELQYADFAQWQLSLQQSPSLKPAFDYWQQQLAGLPQSHNLPLDHPRAAQQTFNGARIEQAITPQLSQQLEHLAKAQGVTLFMLLQTAFATLLSRYSGERDIVMGTPVAGRTQPELEPLIGFFVNTLVLRSELEPKQRFSEQLAGNKAMISQAFDHQQVQFEQLVERLNPQRSMAHNPLFQVMFVLQNASEQALALPQLEVSALVAPKPTIRFDLELKIYPIDGQLQLQWLYNRDLFKPASINRMADNFAVLLTAIVANPEQTLESLPLLHEQERQLLLEWNQTEQDFARDVTMHQLFVEQVINTPEAIAVVDEHGQLSYLELFHQALAICQQLQALHLPAEPLVGVRMAKGRAQVAATLGVMMAGGAYLPMEHFWPDERCAGVLSAANCDWVLIDQSAHRIEGCHAEHLFPATAPSPVLSPKQWLEQNQGAVATEQLAYVIFTSGSTGKPKGVAIEHRSAVNTLLDINQRYHVSASDSILAVSALSFDLSVYDIFGLLAVGGRVIFPADELANDPVHWLNLLEQHDISLWDTTPASAVLLAEQLELDGRVSSASVRHFILSGDWIPPTLPKRLWQVFDGCMVHSQGGATEGSIWSIHYPIEQDTSHLKSIPYGRPLANQRFFILDKDDQLCPIGVIGQLHIAGIGVARAYYNDPARTAASYFYHPELKQKLYRTGDLGRLQVDAQGRPDTIEFIGRVDNQVKVRGYRIEPGEIEATINQHQDITTSLVLPIGDTSEERQLAAYICPSSEYLDSQAKALSDAQVKQWTDIFDDAYAPLQTEQSVAFDTNLSGWNSSYSGEAIAKEQMLEWIEGTVTRILACKNPAKANRILEIGCGTGLLLYRYAEHFDAVHAIDISQTALDTIARQTKAKGWSHVSLHQGDALSAANLVAKLDLAQFDVIVINSVVQYFPNRRYLQQVITTAYQLLSDEGKLFVGDVRNLDLLDSHNCAVLSAKLSEAQSVKTLAAKVQYAVQQEKELLISPSWFAQLNHFSGIHCDVEMLVKRGFHNNEMLRYRYDVIVHRRANTQSPENTKNIDWEQWGETLQSDEAIKARLTQTQAPCLYIAGYPNLRVAKDLWLAEGLKRWHGEHLVSPEQFTDSDVDNTGVALETLFQWAQSQQWQGVATWSQSDLGALDLIFYQGQRPQIIAQAPYRQSVQTNYPQLGRLAAPLTEALKPHLSQNLPNYMLPSYYVYLERLPLSANGKIDRNALPIPASDKLDRGEYIAPTNALEHTLCQLAQKILSLDKVGIEEDFFAIGGHSLLATRFLAAIKEKLAVQLPLRQIFATPTIKALAEVVQTTLADNAPATSSITKVAPAAHYPLSFAQQRLWFIDQMEGASARYNIAGAFELSGQLNIDAFTKAVGAIVNRHDVLRAIYQAHEGDARQYIQNAVTPPVTYQTVEPQQLDEAIAQVTRTPFDLAKDLPLRFALLALAPNQHVVAYAMHHIASDGWSMSRLVEELSYWYKHFCAPDTLAPLAPLAIQYQDYACWQRAFLQGDNLKHQLCFWQQKLQGLPQLHKLPTDKPRPAVQSFAGGKHEIVIATELTAHLQQLAKSQGATLFMLLHSAFSLLLSRYSEQSDIVVGTAIAGRVQPELEPLIGFFVNNLVLRANCDSHIRFNRFLAQNRQFILDAYQHQHLPFEVLVEHLQPARNLSYSPLFQVMLILQNIDEAAFDMPGLTMTPRPNKDTMAKFDLELNVIEYPDKLVMQFSYNADLFYPQTIERMAQNFGVLLKGIVDNPQATLADLPIVSALEKQMQLSHFNPATSAFDPDATIIAWFEKTAAQHSDNIALVHGDNSLSFGELDAKANRLANVLQAQGVSHGQFVGLCLERGIDIVVALLAILKVGAAYVPIDPKAPMTRIEHMLADAKVGLMLSQTGLSDTFALGDTKVLNVDEKCLADYPTQRPQRTLSGQDLAYLIYTSGSTGLPKGVMIEQAALVNSIASDIAIFDVKPHSRVLHMVSLNFDAATSHLFFSLCSGATLYLYDQQQDKLDLMHYAKHHQISHTALPVSVLAAQEKIDVPSLTTLVVGAEHCPEPLADYWSQGRRFFNVYGPTETTITATYADYHKPGQRNTIGQPIRNFTAYVLDNQRRMLPIGAIGELYIGGVGVGRGYLNRPELTEQVFLSDPFSPNTDARMYKTGDLVRYTPQGYLQFIGRVDHQVKVRGFRIELGEIESCLNRLDEVASTVVIAKATEARSDDKQLIAYVVLTDQNEQNRQIGAIVRQLGAVLPEHMVPAQFVTLDKMPLTVNGKIDRAALPEPSGSAQLQTPYVAPRDEFETAMADIWQQLLGAERVGIEDNFFSLGGHSLLATRVLAKVRQRCQYTVPLKLLFEHPTVAALCQAVKGLESSNQLPPVSAHNATGPQPLSFAQQRLWFIDQLEGNSSQYNIPAALKLHGPLEISRLARALSTIIERHHILRTRFFKAADGTPMQQVQSQWQFDLALEEGVDYRQAMALDATTPFDLSQDLMLRAKLLRSGNDEHVLLLNLHHIAADGWSIGALVNELNSLYGGHGELPELSVQYADFALWQRQYLTEQVLDEQLTYWQQQLADLPAVHNLPSDHVRPPRQSYRGRIYRQVIDTALTAKLNALAQAESSTLFMLLHGALSTLIHRYSGDKDIVIGTPQAGRHDSAIEPLIGFFTNTLVLRSDFSKNTHQPNRLADILAHSKTTILAALNHQQLPFELLVEKLNPQRSLSHNPLFQIMLVLQNNAMSELHLGEVSYSPITPEVSSTQFDLNLNINEIDGRLYVNWQYACDLFEQATISQMAEHFAQLLEAFSADLEQPLSAIALNSDPQLQQWQYGPTLEPQQQSLVEVFEQRVDSTPANLALIHTEQLSYAELDGRVNYQAQRLIDHGVVPGDIVCLYAERSVEMFIGLLAILKAGAAYLPFDPILPQAQLITRAQLASPKAILVGPSLAAKEIGAMGDMPALIINQQSSSVRPNVALSANHSAFVLFTSGSTGEPKGIEMGHGALINMINAMRAQHPQLTEQGRVLQFGSIGFDLSFQELFLTITSGSALQLIDEATKPDMAALAALINRQQLTILDLPYAVLQALCEYCNEADMLLPSVKVMLSTAEELKVTKQIRQYFKRHQQHYPQPLLINQYGPTETHVVTSIELTGDPDSWPQLPGIGKPIANTSCLVLDEYGHPVPKGVYGELYLGGVNLAKGYLNRPELTAERFIDLDGARFYRSGDWVRWLDGGNLGYQGRMDNQVQLRGFRVELGDIEACLLRHPQVEKAIAMIIDGQLCAYAESANSDSLALTQWCKGQLPDYMVPQQLLVLTRFALNANGKVDRKALPSPTALSPDGEPPQGETETELAAIWQALLGIEREITRQDNFFALGGHSLLITRLSAKVQAKWQLQLPISAVFEQQQLSALAQWLDEQRLLAQGVGDNSADNASDDEWEF